MNPVNFSNVGTGAMLTGANPQGPMQQPQNAQVQRHIAVALQNQGPFTGWRAEVSIPDRAGKVLQMITSLRLIQPRIEIQNALQAALSFEEKAFREANQRDDYEKECATKLHAIKETRLRQQAVYNQGGLMQHGGANGGLPGVVRPNQMPPQFTPQMNRPMQTSPMPGQIPMHMGMNDPNMIQQQQQNFAQNQIGQQRPPSGMPMVDELSMLSQPDFKSLIKIAREMMGRLPPEELEKRRNAAAAKMTPEQKQIISQKYGDPLTWVMSLQILKSMKARRAQPHNPRAQGLDPNASMVGGDSMMNAAQRQMTPNMMGLQRNSALPMNNQQGLDPAFIGSIENIQVQQADGLRSQEAGQLVVPASSAPMSSQQTFADPNGLFQAGVPQQNTQPNLNRPINPQQFLSQQQQQQLQNTQNVQQIGMQQTSQFQAQARAQAAHNAKMAQAAGQSTNQVNQNMPHQSPAMPMLNRPVGPNMSPAQAVGQIRPPSRQPGVNGQQHGNQQQGMRPQIPNMPNMTPEQVNNYLMQQRLALANSQAARAGNGQPMSMQTNISQVSQAGQFNGLNVGTSMPMQQSLTGLTGSNNAMIQGQQPSQPQQNQQALLRQHQAALMRSQGQNIEMTAEQIRDMDRMAFPPSMINSNANMNPPIPKAVKTWGQLKTYVTQNPGSVDPGKLLDLQRLHFVHTLSQQREAGRNNEQAGQQNWPGNAQPFMPGQNVTGRPQPTLPTVTPEELVMARQKLGPQFQNISDDQLRAFLARNKQKMFLQQLAARGFPVQQPKQAPNQAQPPQTIPMPAQVPNKQMVPPTTQAAQPAQTPQMANAKVQPTPTGAKVAKGGAAGKTASKKRPHSDDVIEIQNPKAQPPQVSPQAVAASVLARPPANVAREQLAGSSQRPQPEPQPQQRQTRLQISRTAAEENWNNALPDQQKIWYHDMSKSIISNAAPKDISAEDKRVMAKQLQDSTDMLSRLDTLVQWFIKLSNYERNIKHLFSMRIHLLRQFKSTEWTVNDEFTIAPEYLKQCLGMIRSMFTSMITRVQSQQLQQKQRAPMPPVGGQPPLNASNLQQLEEEAKRARRTQNQNVPAAPTALQPPFPLGDPSPQGVPQAYGPGGFSPDKLKIPPTKRRKQSHASVSVPQGGAAAKAAAKGDVAKASFKCTVADCEYHVKGFPTQAALNKHVEDEHKVKEEITDPLKYMVDSLDTGLGAPESVVGYLQGENDKKLVSGEASLVKQEVKAEGVTPATGATPMSRLMSQTDGKIISPASTSMTTPRLQAAKATKPAAAKQVKSGAKTDAAKAVLERAPVSDNAAVKDGWADSKVSLDVIQETFDIPMTDSYPGMGGEFFEMFLNSDMFSNQNEDTPDSVDSNTFVTQTPNDGDMAKDDSAIQIQDVEDDGSWPSNWFSHPGPIFSGNDDPWMDWETVNKELEAAPLNKGLSFSVS
ncbi:conserved hypothetical protein [Talaromyces stipitatus ATCC 10500]|uniref:Mediator complex subunit 15 KIX domain-containing protein n=1 Tax=Talaromyces stipitatus (strain ATCC 10500 / CBS 375.48 / QM 6759 / NRRL 1006) TaxID=441959 RepID=B8M840_TALSN|nr:uncharacterized protein TSTA_032570 [Talaromyces stipitatus ATCC 10500]EED20002.1 conserved hypothetical protein [Talaromyces stipitatus ATCC 10500]